MYFMYLQVMRLLDSSHVVVVVVVFLFLRFGRSSLRLTGFVHHFSPRKPALEDKMICGI